MDLMRPSNVILSSAEHYEPSGRASADARYATPDRFTTPTSIEGLLASDIFTLNATA